MVPSLSLIKCYAITFIKLTLVAIVVGLADITLHLRLQSLQHILSELRLETLQCTTNCTHIGTFTGQIVGINLLLMILKVEAAPWATIDSHYAITFIQLTLITIVVGLVDITLHFRLQISLHILSDLWLEILYCTAN